MSDKEAGYVTNRSCRPTNDSTRPRLPNPHKGRCAALWLYHIRSHRHIVSGSTAYRAQLRYQTCRRAKRQRVERPQTDVA